MNATAESLAPYDLLVHLESLAREAIAAREGGTGSQDEWVGVAFRLGGEQFVTPRDQVREVLPVPDHLARIPGAKSWLKGIANVRGHLLPISDLRAYLGGGTLMTDRSTRVVVVNHRECPAGLLVDEVSGFRRFSQNDFRNDGAATIIRCENYLSGVYRTDGAAWPIFDLFRLVEDGLFLQAGE